ncbi:MAG: hypothetical protein AB1757_25580 [Acidobacteriota bacterium]
MWMKLFVIASVTMIVALAIGFLGGIFLLIALNGFSESRATPILITYIIIALLGTLTLSTLVSWGFAKRLADATPISFGGVLSVNLISLLGILLVGAASISIWLKLK